MEKVEEGKRYDVMITYYASISLSTSYNSVCVCIVIKQSSPCPRLVQSIPPRSSL